MYIVTMHIIAHTSIILDASGSRRNIAITSWMATKGVSEVPSWPLIAAGPAHVGTRKLDVTRRS